MHNYMWLRLFIQKPTEIVLGERWVTKTSGRRCGELVHKEDKFVYVPILETLEMLLKNESLSTEVITCIM